MPLIVIKLRDGGDVQRLYQQVYKGSGKDYVVDQWTVFDKVPPAIQDAVITEFEKVKEGMRKRLQKA